MAEYIEREKLLRAMVCDDSEGANLFQVGIAAAKAIVSSAPTADVAPVVHGRWDTNTDPGEEIKDFHCSVCEYLLCDIDTACIVPGENDFYFCPNCGAKMDLMEDA